MERKRLDAILVYKGLAESREKAQRLIRAGLVSVDGLRADKPGRGTRPGCSIEVIRPDRFVGRGAEKLEYALEFFAIDVSEAVCLDVGSSTGGFTDCMLQRGARKVYAVDAGRGQLHWKLRNDPRVVVMERTNARYLKTGDLSELPSFAAVDVSFISLTKILPSVKSVLVDAGLIVSLIKPQFEAARADVGRGGVVRDAGIRQETVDRVRAFGTGELSLRWLGVCESPIKGTAGNVEFLALWKTK